MAKGQRFALLHHFCRTPMSSFARPSTPTKTIHQSLTGLSGGILFGKETRVFGEIEPKGFPKSIPFSLSIFFLHVFVLFCRFSALVFVFVFVFLAETVRPYLSGPSVLHPGVRSLEHRTRRSFGSEHYSSSLGAFTTSAPGTRVHGELKLSFFIAHFVCFLWCSCPSMAAYD